MNEFEIQTVVYLLTTDTGKTFEERRTFTMVPGPSCLHYAYRFLTDPYIKEETEHEGITVVRKWNIVRVDMISPRSGKGADGVISGDAGEPAP